MADFDSRINAAYLAAQDRFASIGVDAEAAMQRLQAARISLHCWQGDDVAGFDGSGVELGSGLAVTGNYHGRARTVNELRSDLDVALAMIPGRHRLNLHAIYGEFSGRVERDEINASHFQGWIEWAKARQMGLDFNPTFFAHPMAADGFTLAAADRGKREFWIRHGKACRRIAAAFGAALGSPCVHNVWIPDGFKDSPADRVAPRQRLSESLDALFSEPMEVRHVVDAVEAKLFGIGSESYVVGSHEFYLGYAISRRKALCLDAGHFHPTESIADKISSVLLYVPELLLHVSRGVRWDSDHVVTFNDDLQAITQEIVRGNWLDRVHLGLDYFDASINRVAAWVIGSRNLLKGLLTAMLEPLDAMRAAESSGDLTQRLALQEEMKSMPVGAVWDYYCLTHNVPVGIDWLARIQQYERDVLVHRA